MTDTINFTYNKYERFEKAYKQAIEDNKTDFFFEGHQFLTSYAKYLLEHLNNKTK